MINLPIVLQKNDFSCGEAVVKSVLQYYGINLKSKFASEIDGTSPRTIENQLRLQKLNIISGNFSISLLDYFIKLKKPVISCFLGHWVVFVGKLNKSYFYFDPEHFEYQKISVQKLKNIWYDHDTMNVKYDRWCVVCI